ncbi:uncharacterized protein LOC106092230 [Stomoxys calcitrans]|uniref:uncharacterized protein LOC106092230 n=1 Tax=Stomoxys calcitrans TaxID=35570 RepID=UPI0027E2B972|nr:uncharacterized protein LOC106092230 [Stomoxys calcitrans]
MKSVHQISCQRILRRMKATGLILIAFGFAAMVQASKRDYALKCNPEEMGIRWPSYKSNAEYYVCHRVGERPMVMSCNPGEIFTFVLQICTAPNKYIPAPELHVLPTSSPFIGSHHHGSNQHKHSDSFRPLEIFAHPPILSETHHHAMPALVPEMPIQMIDDVPKPPIMTVDELNRENSMAHEAEIAIESGKPQQAAGVPPMPPTPAPTPPVVDVHAESGVHKPSIGGAKKPSAEKKKSAIKPGKSEKKPADTKEGKKLPKKPAKTPAKIAKKPAPAPKKSAPAPKKSPKATKKEE